MKYPKNLVGLKFGFLTVISKLPGSKNENSLWLCRCDCGSKNCKKFVAVRRGLLTREECSKITCGGDFTNTAQKASITKLVSGKPQNNSKTKIPGVTFCPDSKGLYRARIDILGERLEERNLSFHDACLTREAWNKMKKVIVKKQAIT